MMRSLPGEEVAEAVADVLAVPAEAEPEPYLKATSLDREAPVGVDVQRARFPTDRPAEDVPGRLLVSIDVPYWQLPSSQPVIPDDPAHDGQQCQLPPGTSPDHVSPDEPATRLAELGREHDIFVTDLADLLDSVPVVEGADGFDPTCLGYDGEAASFGDGVAIDLDGAVDPAEGVPEGLCSPAPFSH